MPLSGADPEGNLDDLISKLRNATVESLNALGWIPTETGEWFACDSCPWLFNPKENVLYCSTDGRIVSISGKTEDEKFNADYHCATDSEQCGSSHINQTEHFGSSVNSDKNDGECASDENEDEDSDIDIDLEADVLAGTFQQKGTAVGKTECEDRYLTKTELPLAAVANNDQALCYFSALFDGHGGSWCADYVITHLHKNILSCYRHIYSHVKKKREEGDAECIGASAKKRKAQHQMLLAHLNRFVLPDKSALRHEERFMSTTMEALVRSIFKAFQVTENNILETSHRIQSPDCGCTACAAIIFGPDEDGSLKLITAHTGDTRAILSREGNALRLTEDHKPNLKEEKARIEKAGGQVAELDGTWRALRVDSRNNRATGLSTSRSFGDQRLKQPNEIISALPSVRIRNIHFDRDEFLAIGSDGIFDVLSDREVVNIVRMHITKSPKQAAQAVVEAAKNKGSEDDLTCTVMYFLWRKGIFPPSLRASMEGEGPSDAEEPDGQTDFIVADKGEFCLPSAKEKERESHFVPIKENDGTNYDVTTDSSVVENECIRHGGLEEIISRENGTISGVLRKRKRDSDEIEPANSIPEDDDIDLFSLE